MVPFKFIDGNLKLFVNTEQLDEYLDLLIKRFVVETEIHEGCLLSLPCNHICTTSDS